MEIDKIDHLVLTVRNIEETLQFYKDVLGMESVTFGEGRTALKFGDQKLNLHELGNEFEPRAIKPTPGAIDICFTTQIPLKEAMEHVENCGIKIIEGPVNRTGANGSLLSFYFRDPSENLIEVANEV